MQILVKLSDDSNPIRVPLRYIVAFKKFIGPSERICVSATSLAGEVCHNL